MSALGRFGGRAAAAASAVVASASASSSVQARAPVQAPTRADAHHAPLKTIDEEWLVTDCAKGAQGDVILFRPFQAYEIDDALAEVAGLMHANKENDSLLHGTQLKIEEHDSGMSTPSSDGSQANAVISGASLAGYGSPGRMGARSGIEMQTLLELTNKMLRRPGMQTELVKALMEDQEIQEILVRECGDLDTYLLAAGVAPVTSLLPPAAAAAAATVADSDEGKDVFAHLVDSIMFALEKAGTAVGRLAGWLRDRLPFLGRRSVVQDEQDDGTSKAAGSGTGSTRAAQIFQGVLAVGAVVIFMIVFKRAAPSFMRRRV